MLVTGILQQIWFAIPSEMLHITDTNVEHQQGYIDDGRSYITAHNIVIILYTYNLALHSLPICCTPRPRINRPRMPNLFVGLLNAVQAIEIH